MHGLGPYIVANFVAHSHTPHDRCVRLYELRRVKQFVRERPQPTNWIFRKHIARWIHLQAPQFGILGMKALSLLGSAERSTPKPVGARLRAGLTAKAHAKQ